MLAAACPAQPGQSVLELGCGAGVAVLCLGQRVADLRLTGLELQPDYAALARRNAEENQINLQVIEGDLERMPKELRSETFDHVIANPPYFRDGTHAPDSGRDTARHEATGLAGWVDATLRRTKPAGQVTFIHRAERLGDLLVALDGRAGSVAVLPIAARHGREAGRVIVNARKGSRGALRLLAPLIMHAKLSHLDDAEDLTEAAQRVLRDGQAITGI